MRTLRLKITIVVFSVFVLLLLVIAGPAQGFNANVSMDKNVLRSGEDLVFGVDIGYIGESEIENISFEVNGPLPAICVFDSEGNAIRSCEGVSAVRKSFSGFGYGYGYGFGEASYEIVLDSGKFDLGEYSVTVTISSKDSVFVEERDFSIIHGSSSGGSCFTEWICSEWSDCVNGKQERVCSGKIRYCYAGNPPEMTRSCEINENFSEIYEPIKLNNEKINSEEDFSSFVTGAVVGNTNNLAGLTIFVLFLGIIALLLAIVYVKNIYH